jgi:superfamily I DNA/RNA helicase
LDEDYLILSTIHSAKGLEWRSVFILNAIDALHPSDLSTGHIVRADGNVRGRPFRPLFYAIRAQRTYSVRSLT